MSKFKVVDLFSGAGGMSLGFEMTGDFEVVAALDNWGPAIDTFKYNHPHVDPERIVCAGVDEVFTHRDQPYDELLNWLKTIDVDVVIGGPPCQGMSLAGKRLSSDPRNQLFKSFVDAVDLIQPKVFVMENVPGLLSIDKGAINVAILQAFADIGYNHFSEHAPAILKAECFGVPQIRRRLFYVGFRNDIDPSLANWPPRPIYQEFDLKKESGVGDMFSLFEQGFDLPQPITVKEAIDDLPKLKTGEGSDEIDFHSGTTKLSEFQKYVRDWSTCPELNRPRKIFNHEAPNHTQKLIDLIKAAEPGNSVDPKYTDSKMWHPDRPGFTVKALGAGGGSTNRRAFHFDPEQPRGSTVRENARIQSFPDWHRFMGAKTHQMSQVGNAVPPLLGKVVGQVISGKLESHEK